MSVKLVFIYATDFRMNQDLQATWIRNIDINLEHGFLTSEGGHVEL